MNAFRHSKKLESSEIPPSILPWRSSKVPQSCNHCAICPVTECFLKEVIWLPNYSYRWHRCSDCTITFSQRGIWIGVKKTFIHSRLAIDVTCLWSGSIMPLWKSSVMSVVNLKSVIRDGVLKHPVLKSSLVGRKTPFCIINFVLLSDGACCCCCFPTCWTGNTVCDWAFRPNLAVLSLLILKSSLQTRSDQEANVIVTMMCPGLTKLATFNNQNHTNCSTFVIDFFFFCIHHGCFVQAEMWHDMTWPRAHFSAYS